MIKEKTTPKCNEKLVQGSRLNTDKKQELEQTVAHCVFNTQLDY